MNDEDAAEGLGLFSLALGATEVMATKPLTEYFGLEKDYPTVKAFGLREIAAGAGILLAHRKGPWVWARVAGDVLDLAALGMGMVPGNRKRGRVAVAIGVVAAITALDVVVAKGLTDRGR